MVSLCQNLQESTEFADVQARVIFIIILKSVLCSQQLGALQRKHRHFNFAVGTEALLLIGCKPKVTGFVPQQS